MSWTQGQQNRTSQSPFIDPVTDDRPQKVPTSTGYSKPNVQRNDYNQRPPQHNMQQRQPQIRDVAATFTQEGLQTFSLIFSSAVEAAIAKTLPDLVERAVERKMQDLVRQVRDEISRLSSDVVEPIAQSTFAAIEQRLETMLARNAATFAPAMAPAASPVFEPAIASTTSTAAAPTTSPVVEPIMEPTATQPVDVTPSVERIMEPTSTQPVDVASRVEMDVASSVEMEVPVLSTQTITEPIATDEKVVTTPVVSRARRASGATVDETRAPSMGRLEQEVQWLIQAMKALGRPVKTDELRNLIPEVKWGSNPSIKMSNLMQKSNGQIERTSKGIYQYT